MFSFILSLSLLVGQQTYLYNSENAYFKEAPAFVLKAETPSHTPKTVNPQTVSKPQPKPLRIDVREIEPLTIEVKPLPPLKVEIPEGKVTETVYFDLNSPMLKPSEKAKLDGLSKNFIYEMIGYTCDTGTKDYNDRLALKRAESVKEYLGGLGKARGDGKCCYADKTDKSKNRRVEIKPLDEIKPPPGVSQFNNQLSKKKVLKSKEVFP